MKKKVWLIYGWGLFVPFIAGLVFLGCNQVNELAAVDFNTELNFSVGVTELSAGDNINYNESLILDASANPEIKKYGSKIRSIEVQSMEFAIDDYTTIVTDEIYLNDAVFGFGDKSSIDPEATCNVDALPVTHWAGTDYFKFDSCNGTLNAIENALSKDQFVKVFIKGTLTKAPVSFSLKVRMKVRVTATPL
jgi:hypothetical protein